MFMSGSFLCVKGDNYYIRNGILVYVIIRSCYDRKAKIL